MLIETILTTIERALERAEEDLAKTTADAEQAKRDYDATKTAYLDGVAIALENKRQFALGEKTAIETLLYFVKQDIRIHDDIHGKDEAQSA